LALCEGHLKAYQSRKLSSCSKIIVSWLVTQCAFVGGYESFGGNRLLPSSWHKMKTGQQDPQKLLYLCTTLRGVT
jgi:hypothetical protein